MNLLYINRGYPTLFVCTICESSAKYDKKLITCHTCLHPPPHVSIITFDQTRTCHLNMFLCFHCMFITCEHKTMDIIQIPCLHSCFITTFPQFLQRLKEIPCIIFFITSTPQIFNICIK